jgi:4-amino-4-deoxy-L-arabinose transferase-like glycosyltransferase
MNSNKIEPLACESPQRREWIILVAGVFTVALIIRLVCFTGLIASDDLDYVNYARQISEGTYRLESYHSAVRYGVFMPVGVIYWLFGIHEWTTIALPLICSSLAGMFTALLAAQLAGLPVAWVSGLLMATFPVDVRYASILVPEPFLQAIVLAAALLFLLAQRKNSDLFGFAAGLFLGLSYLTKEPGVFVAIAFVAFALLRRRWRLASSVLVGFALVIAGELACYWSQSGDLLFRLHAFAAHNSDTTDNLLREANEHLSYRLWQVYPRMMLRPNIDFGVHSVFALGLAAIGWRRWRYSRTAWLLLLWAALPFLYLNFGTSSFSFYWALPAAPRYISPIYPPLFVLAAMVSFNWAGSRPKRRWVVGVTVAVIGIVGVSCAVTTRGTDYRTGHVQRLKEIAAVARRQNNQICVFESRAARQWRQVLQIIAPDRIGCSGATVLQLLPDSKGLPMTKHL